MKNFDGVNPDNNHLGVYNPPRRKSKLRRFITFFLILLILGGAGFLAWNTLLKANSIFAGKTNVFRRVGQLFISNDKTLTGEDQGLVNVLLLGVGGEGHDGAYLTDTMIVASINTRTNEVVLTSIPRDWIMPIEKHGLNKINAVYAYGLQDHPTDPNQAGLAAIKAAEEVTGFSIPYYAVVDFKGFVSAVDHVGGVDVNVERTFTDSTFPNDFPYDTKGYLSPVTFTKGEQHMNGRQALIFARSRHSSNPDEGSDFARSERQKKIMVAMKDELMKLNITNLNTLNNLLSDFTSNFRTNLEPYELLRLANITKNIAGSNIYSLSLEPQGDLICDLTIDQLTGKPYIHPAAPTVPDTTTPTTSTSTKPTTTNTATGTPTTKTTPGTTGSTTTSQLPDSGTTEPKQIPMYIVQPCYPKTLSDIHAFLADYLVLARLTHEGAVVEIQNSTGKPGILSPWKGLEKTGATVKYTAFKGKVPFDKTILYDNSKGSKPKTLQYLKDNYRFTTADVTYTDSKSDFVIILGNE